MCISPQNLQDAQNPAAIFICAQFSFISLLFLPTTRIRRPLYIQEDGNIVDPLAPLFFVTFIIVVGQMPIMMSPVFLPAPPTQKHTIMMRHSYAKHPLPANSLPALQRPVCSSRNFLLQIFHSLSLQFSVHQFSHSRFVNCTLLVARCWFHEVARTR